MSNIQIKGVLYQSKSAKKVTNSTTPRGRDASNGSGLSPTNNRSSQNIQNDNNNWGQNTSGTMLNQQHLAQVKNQQPQLPTSASSSYNQEFNQSNLQQQSQQQYFVNQSQQQNQKLSARQVFNQAQYINSIINRSRSPLNKQQSSQQSGISPSSRSANKYSNITQLITPSKTQRLATESQAQSANNPRYQVAKSPRTQNNMNQNNSSAVLSSGFGMSAQNQNNNSNNQSIYNMILNDEIQNNKQFYQNAHQLRKLNQQSHSYHNLQQYLQANNSNNSQLSSQNNNLNNNSISNINNLSINNQGMNTNNSYLNSNNNNSNNSMLEPQNNNISSYLIQSSQNQEKSSSSSLNRFSGGDSQAKNQSQQILGSQQAQNNISPFLNRAENNNIRSSGLKLNPAKQMSNGSNINNNSIQKTNYTMHSNCTNCIEFEKELELLKSIIKSCSKCQHSYLSNSSNNSHPNQNADSLEKMAMFDPDNNFDNNNNNFNGNNNAQYVLEKINNMRLQEQVQSLMRQLDQVKIERDQLNYGQFNQSQEIIEKIQKYESQIKMLSQSHAKVEQKLGNYNILKSKLQDFLNSFVASIQSPDRSNNKDLLQECLFIKDFISNQQSSINTLNQRQLITAKPSLQNSYSLYNQNLSNLQSFNQDNSKVNIGELVNQQLVLEEREQIQNQYQALPSALKALEIAHRIKNTAQQNPFLPNQ